MDPTKDSWLPESLIFSMMLIIEVEAEVALVVEGRLRILATRLGVLCPNANVRSVKSGRNIYPSKRKKKGRWNYSSGFPQYVMQLIALVLITVYYYYSVPYLSLSSCGLVCERDGHLHPARGPSISLDGCARDGAERERERDNSERERGEGEETSVSSRIMFV